MERQAEIDAFLAANGWGDAERAPLPGDASTRRYIRVRRGGKRAMLMDAPGRGEDPPCPPGADAATRLSLGWNATSRLAASRVDAFVALARHLTGLGLSAPAILAADPARGLALTEDFGDGLFASLLAEDTTAEAALYAEAGTLAGTLQTAGAPTALPVEETGADWPLLEFDAVALAANVDLFAEWLPRFLGEDGLPAHAKADWAARRDALVAEIDAHAKALTLRDYHAENLLWMPEREGLKRVGLLDFQDAVIGPRTWDLSMLLHDARRDVSDAAARAALAAYLDTTGASEAEIAGELAVAGLANTLRILGIFSRLVARDGKERYRGFMPREWRHLARLSAHPAAARHAPLIALAAPGWRERAA